MKSSRLGNSDSTDLDDNFLASSIKQVAKGMGIIFIGIALGRGIGFLTKVIIGRSLGPEEFGLFNIGYAILMLFTIIALLGLPEGVSTFIPRYKAKNEPRKLKGTITSSLKIAAISSLFFMLLISVFSGKISIVLFHEKKLGMFLKFFALAIPFSALSALLVADLRGFKSMKQMVLARDISGNIVLLLSLSLFLVIGYGILGVIFSFIISYVIISILALYYIIQNFKVFGEEVKNVSVTRELINFSWPLAGSRTLGQVRRYADIFLLGYFTSSLQVGIYSAGIVIVSIIMIVAISINTILLPVNSELYAGNRRKEIGALYSIVVKWLVVILFPIFLLTFFLPETLIAALFGAKYVEGAIALRILSIGYFISACIGSWLLIIYAMGKTKIDLIVKAFGVISNIGLSLVLIPRWGIIGAAVASSFSLALVEIIGLSVFYRYFKMWPFKMRYLKYLVFTTFSFSIFYFISNSSPFINAPSLVVLLFAVYFSINLLFLLKFIGLDIEDKVVLRALEKKIGINITRWLGLDDS